MENRYASIDRLIESISECVLLLFYRMNAVVFKSSDATKANKRQQAIAVHRDLFKLAV